MLWKLCLSINSSFIHHFIQVAARAFFAKTHQTQSVFMTDKTASNEQTSFRFSLCFEEVGGKNARQLLKSIGAGAPNWGARVGREIYDLLLLQQKQDFVVSARVPLQRLFRGHYFQSFFRRFFAENEVQNTVWGS